MVDKLSPAEPIWVTIKQAAEMTGYHPRTLRRFVDNLLSQSESERSIQVRQRDSNYELWLPDVIDFVSQYGAGRLNPEVEAIWVNTTEGAEITGYSRVHVQKLARENWNLPEDRRLIRVRLRSNRYDVWLPDLVKFIINVGHGPHQKSS